jgi:hypothetical protein
MSGIQMGVLFPVQSVQLTISSTKVEKRDIQISSQLRKVLASQIW